MQNILCKTCLAFCQYPLLCDLEDGSNRESPVPYTELGLRDLKEVGFPGPEGPGGNIMLEKIKEECIGVC